MPGVWQPQGPGGMPPGGAGHGGAGPPLMQAQMMQGHPQMYQQMYTAPGGPGQVGVPRPSNSGPGAMAPQQAQQSQGCQQQGCQQGCQQQPMGFVPQQGCQQGMPQQGIGQQGMAQQNMSQQGMSQQGMAQGMQGGPVPCGGMMSPDQAVQHQQGVPMGSVPKFGGQPPQMVLVPMPAAQFQPQGFVPQQACQGQQGQPCGVGSCGQSGPQAGGQQQSQMMPQPMYHRQMGGGGGCPPPHMPGHDG